MVVLQLSRRQQHQHAATGYLLDVVLPDSLVSVEPPTNVCG